MARPPRITPNVAKVLVALLEGPLDGLYGLEVGQAAHIPTGSIYPTLDKLVRAKWIDTRLEDGDPVKLGRPLRRFYKLTPNGVAIAMNARAAHSEWGPERGWATP